VLPVVAGFRQNGIWSYRQTEWDEINSRGLSGGLRETWAGTTVFFLANVVEDTRVVTEIWMFKAVKNTNYTLISNSTSHHPS